MNSEMKMVLQFHRKHKSHISVPLSAKYSSILQQTANVSEDLAVALMKKLDVNDCRILRAQLIIEETSECIYAMLNGNELDLLDGLCDLMYVIIGTAITFDLPLPKAFCEVHRANMKKVVSREVHRRVKNKGKDWLPPNLKPILIEHRKKETL